MKKISLEKMIGAKKVEKFKNSTIYSYIVDTSAMITFATPIAMGNEILVAGMDVTDSLKARGIA